MADDDSLSSSSSDDDFLTMGENGRSQDREALIRKKLMESFYGKTAPAEANQPDASNVPASPDKAGRPGETGNLVGTAEDHDGEGQQDDDILESGASDDLDSPYFDPDGHTSRHVLGSSVHQLLETEERLALQVRTLDSTMQTLVYENYSKFIDATDAIRSIGVSVHANEEGLGRLSAGMQKIDQQSKEVEEALGTLRDAVAEKLRVKRLLTRLDSLLKLPATLKQQIGAGTYRLATKSYFSAHAILSKHSAGFESLKTIELDCHSILSDMVETLKHKLLYWSGQTPGFRAVTDDVEGEMLDDTEENNDETPAQPLETSTDEEWTPPPDPPKTISEIFECAGTLLIVLPKGDGTDQGITFDSGLTIMECKSMALYATIRFLERVLDEHQIELQDTMFGGGDFIDEPFEAKMSKMDPVDTATPRQLGTRMVPTKYLDSMLEAATLFGISFSLTGTPSLTDGDRTILKNFVSEAFSTFLGHVRSVLLEHSVTVDSDDEDDEKAGTSDDEGDDAYNEVSGAMTRLLHSVQELASGLSLPDVGVEPAFAGSLVEQAVDVTESMVRRRVAEKFYSLRVRVVKDCFSPFVKDALVHKSEADTPRVVDIVQIASVALSDGLQLVDDTIRSILTGGLVISDLKGVDFVMVKDAVQRCCRVFSLWLAGCLEELAGCDPCSSKLTIEAEETMIDAGDEANETPEPVNVETSGPADDVSDVSGLEDALAEKIENGLETLKSHIDQAESRVADDLLLAMSELCRLAQRSVIENINQSIASTVGVGRKNNMSSDIFKRGSSKARKLSEEDKKVSQRFNLAASRILAQYALNLGLEAARLVCSGYDVIADLHGEDLPQGPRQETLLLLERAKQASVDSAIVFGGETSAGPVPDPPDDEAELLNTGVGLRSSLATGSMGSSLSAIKGLQLDVERMFIEKVPAYPHPSKLLDYTRNAVVTMVLKTCFNAMVEKARACTFRSQGFHQIHVDVEFLRYILPHYVKDDLITEGINSLTILDNILNEVKTNAGDRTKDIDSVNQTSFFNPTTGETTTIQSIIRDFMRTEQDDAKKEAMQRFIIEG